MPHPLTADDQGFLCYAFMDDARLLLSAYRFGIFPWDNIENIGAFYFPVSRYLIEPSKIRVPRSMRSYFNQHKFSLTLDLHFDTVIRNCARIKRSGQSSTWISQQFIDVYTTLHRLGYAHSVEVWHEGQLVGGLYGIAVGKIFTGESMFSLHANASRFAMISLARFLEQKGFTYIDAQVYNPYVASFGGGEVARADFYKIMKANLLNDDLMGPWSDLMVP